MREAGPCKKCGSTKTGSVRHGLMHQLARAMGYHLRTCGGCHKLRLIRRHTDGEPEVIARHMGENPTSSKRKDPHGCPYCGCDDLRRSRRRWYERILKRSHMARCRNCRRRFPWPKVRTHMRESITEKSA